MWELRTRERVHTSSALMCWAACDRLARIAAHRALPERARLWQDRAAEIRGRDRDARLRSRRAAASWTASAAADVEAGLLLMAEVGFLPAEDPRFAGTVAAIEKRLRRGRPPVPLCRGGRLRPADDRLQHLHLLVHRRARAHRPPRRGARAVRAHARSRNHLGLLSEDIDPETASTGATTRRPTRWSASSMPRRAFRAAGKHSREQAPRGWSPCRIASGRSRAQPRPAGSRSALVDALRERGGLWFGWSGHTWPRQARLHTEKADGITLATLDLTQQDYDGYLQRLQQQLPVAAAAFPHRPDAFRAPPARDLPAGQPAVRAGAREAPAPRRPGVGARLPPAPARRGAAPATGCASASASSCTRPFPPTEILSTLPVHESLMRSLFAYDLIGFQTGEDLARFQEHVRARLRRHGARRHRVRLRSRAARSAPSRSASTSTSSTATPSPRRAAASSRACGSVLRGPRPVHRRRPARLQQGPAAAHGRLRPLPREPSESAWQGDPAAGRAGQPRQTSRPTAASARSWTARRHASMAASRASTGRRCTTSTARCRGARLPACIGRAASES